MKNESILQWVCSNACDFPIIDCESESSIKAERIKVRVIIRKEGKICCSCAAWSVHYNKPWYRYLYLVPVPGNHRRAVATRRFLRRRATVATHDASQSVYTLGLEWIYPGSWLFVGNNEGSEKDDTSAICRWLWTNYSFKGWFMMIMIRFMDLLVAKSFNCTCLLHNSVWTYLGLKEKNWRLAKFLTHHFDFCVVPRIKILA